MQTYLERCRAGTRPSKDQINMTPPIQLSHGLEIAIREGHGELIQYLREQGIEVSNNSVSGSGR